MKKTQLLSIQAAEDPVVAPLQEGTPGGNREKASRFALLGMLSLGAAQSGYDLKKAIASTTASFWRESYGNIYPTLRKLVEEGLIRPHKPKTDEPGRRKQLYSITARGKDVLAAWLQQPVATRTEDNELLLKLFFGSMMPVQAAQELVNVHRDHHLTLLKRFVAIERDIASGPLSEDQKTYLRVTLEYGRAVSQALVVWAGSTVDMLARLQSSHSGSRRTDSE